MVSRKQYNENYNSYFKIIILITTILFAQCWQHISAAGILTQARDLFTGKNSSQENEDLSQSSSTLKDKLTSLSQTYNSSSPTVAGLAAKVVTKTATKVIGKKIKKETGIDISKLPDPRIIPPIFKFVVGLPFYIINSIKKWTYNNATVSVDNQAEATTSSTETTASVSSETTASVSSETTASVSSEPTESPSQTKINIANVVKIELDLLFKGHGDPTKPIGYTISDDKYYYTPGLNFLSIQINNSKIVLQDILTGAFKDILLLLLNTINAKELAGITSTGITSVADILNKIAVMTPEDVFVFKLLQLLGSAIKNSSLNVGYPRISHIPLEIAVLLNRLSITPDYNATMLAHNNNVKNAYEWDKAKIVYLSNPFNALMNSSLNASKDFFESLEEAIPCEIPKNQWDKYQDSKRSVVTNDSLKMTIAKTWQESGYNNRSDAILRNIIRTANFASYSLDEQQLWLTALTYHVSKRNTGLSLFCDLCDQYLLNPNMFNQLINSSSFNIGMFTNILDKRTSLVKILCKETLKLLSPFTSNNNLISQATNYLTTQLTLIEEEIINYKNLINQILELKNNNSPTSDISSAIDNLRTALLESDQKTVAPSFSSDTNSATISIKLRDYLDLQFVNFKRCLNYKFRGDPGYIENPLPLSLQEAIEYAMAIVLRGFKDYNKATELFKIDNQTYSMIDINGKPVDIVGKSLYSKTAKQADEYSSALNSETYVAKKESLTLGTPAARLLQLSDKANTAERIITTLKTEYTHYLRQYHFDRRSTPESITLGNAKLSIDNKINQKTSSDKQTENPKDTSNTATEKTNTLTTQNANLDIFASKASDYPDSLNSFFKEEFTNLLKKSVDFVEKGSLFIDPILISCFGCNIATIAESLDDQSLAASEKELSELLTYEIDENSSLASLKEILEKTKKNIASEQNALKTNDALIKPASLSTTATSLIQIPTFSVSSEVSNIIDSVAGFSINIAKDISKDVIKASEAPLDKLLSPKEGRSPSTINTKTPKPQETLQSETSESNVNLPKKQPISTEIIDQSEQEDSIFTDNQETATLPRL